MRCAKSYFQAGMLKDTGVRLNVIGGAFDIDNSNVDFYAPKPFIMLGWTPGDGSGSVEDLSLAPFASQAAYSIQLETLWRNMVAASMQKDLPQNGVTYKDVSGNIWEGYINQYLNNPIGNVNSGPLNEANLLAFRMPLAMVGSFWADYTGTAEEMLAEVYALAKNIQSLTDLRLWCPPGQYRVIVSADPPLSLQAVLDDPEVGDTEGLSALVLELQGTE